MAFDQSSSQVEQLFKEFHMMVKKVGIENSIIHLKSISRYNGALADDVSIYEFIINTVANVFDITKTKLFEDKKKYGATDARRVTYVLINKYLKYSQTEIGVQFKKTKNLINIDFAKHNKFMKDNWYKEYQSKYNQADAEIEKFIRTIKKSKKDKNAN